MSSPKKYNRKKTAGASPCPTYSSFTIHYSLFTIPPCPSLPPGGRWILRSKRRKEPALITLAKHHNGGTKAPPYIFLISHSSFIIHYTSRPCPTACTPVHLPIFHVCKAKISPTAGGFNPPKTDFIAQSGAWRSSPFVILHKKPLPVLYTFHEICFLPQNLVIRP